jgi:hypothetical protein
MFCILFVTKLRPFFGAGPIWFAAADTSACSENWWTNLLYLNNFLEISGKVPKVSNRRLQTLVEGVSSSQLNCYVLL